MKQLINLQALIIGFLLITSAARSQLSTTNESQELSVGFNYSFDNSTCTHFNPNPEPNIFDIIQGQSDSKPDTPNTTPDIVYRSAEELQIHQSIWESLWDDPSKLDITIEKKDQSYITDVVIDVADGVKIHLVQSEEDFRDIFSTNVESIELHWMGNTPNDERSIELTRQEVDRQSVSFTFKLTEIASGCTDFLSLSISTGIPEDKIVIVPEEIVR